MKHPTDWSAPNRLYGGAWNATRMLMRGPLTDRKIARYLKLGFYSSEFRAARKEVQLRKRRKRSGNLVYAEDGRPIYSPL